MKYTVNKNFYDLVKEKDTHYRAGDVYPKVKATKKRIARLVELGYISEVVNLDNDTEEPEVTEEVVEDKPEEEKAKE